MISASFDKGEELLDFSIMKTAVKSEKKIVNLVLKDSRLPYNSTVTALHCT